MLKPHCYWCDLGQNSFRRNNENFRRDQKQVFWQAYINNQRSNLKIQTNDTETVGLFDRYRCNHNFTKIRISILMSLRGKYSDSKDWNFFSGKTKYDMSLVFWARNTERKIKAMFDWHSYKLMWTWLVAAMKNPD